MVTVCQWLFLCACTSARLVDNMLVYLWLWCFARVLCDYSVPADEGRRRRRQHCEGSHGTIRVSTYTSALNSYFVLLLYRST
jgi:hypothetical protein